MRYVSTFSGIEAATVAWWPLSDGSRMERAKAIRDELTEVAK